ncbi:MAG: hypothetical protein AB7U63_07575 [Porticoccaceae bacterium]
MLIRLLSDPDKIILLKLANLLCLSDNPLHWDGKTSDELTSNSDFGALSIQENELESELLSDMLISAGLPEPDLSITNKEDEIAYKSIIRGYVSPTAAAVATIAGIGRPKSSKKTSLSVQERLVETLKSFSVAKLEQPEIRAQASTTVLRELIKNHTFVFPSSPKIILYELFLVALRDGHISNIEWTLLREYQHHYGLEDFIFEDLLERAESLNQEMNKTISLVLE